MVADDLNDPLKHQESMNEEEPFLRKHLFISSSLKTNSGNEKGFSSMFGIKQNQLGKWNPSLQCAKEIICCLNIIASTQQLSSNKILENRQTDKNKYIDRVKTVISPKLFFGTAVDCRENEERNRKILQETRNKNDV